MSFIPDTAGQILNAPINVDAATDSELQELIESPAVNAYVKRYAHMTLIARSYRLEGKISDALAMETRAEQVYKYIPVKLRW